jgi:hypothetical protein
MTFVTDPDNLDRFQVCIDPVGETISLRGLGTERHAVDQTGDSDGTTTFTDAGANFTTDGVVAGDVLTIISDPAEDGGIIGHYRVVTAGTTTLTVERAIPASTAADLTYKINAPQTPGAATPQVADGVDLQALFSFLKEEWITLAAGLGNAEDLNQFDFPLQAISSAAGQYIMGGINGDAASAWSYAALNGVQSTDIEGETRTLIRNGGWEERNVANVILREYANYTTLGTLDSDAQVTYQQGDANGDPADFQLTGAVNQAVLTLGPDVGPDAVGTGFAFTATTITRNDGGNWKDDNYRVGDYVTIRGAEDAPNNGNFGPITAVDDAVDGAITIASASFTVNADDTTAIFSVDHTRYTVLRVRKKRRSYAQAAHADAGVPAAGILPLVNKFPLSHASDPAITLDDGVVSGGDGTATGDLFQETENHTTGSDGAIPASVADDGTFTFTSAGSTFNSTARGAVQILRPGDSLAITSGTYQGVYEIKSIDSATVLTLFAEPGRTYPGVETALTFVCRTGVLDVGATNATLANVDGNTGTLTSVGSTFDVDTALGDRIVTTGDIVEVFAGTGAVIGYYKVVSRDSATVLTLNTSDQIFSGETSQSYRIWRPGMFLQRFVSSATDTAGSIDFSDDNPDNIIRGAGSWITDGFTPGMAITVANSENSGENDGTFILDTVVALTMQLIAEETLVDNVDDTTATITGDSGITRAINGITYPFHWRLFANGAGLANVFQFIQRELRRATDIDGGNGTERGDITDLLMTFVSPNGVTLDMFPDNLLTGDLNNVTYQDITGDSRNNAFLVGITFDVNANLIAAPTSRLVAYFTTNPAGNFGTNNAVIVDDDLGADMDFSAIAADIQTTFDYTNNAQGGRTPDTDADITVVALGDDNAQYVLVTATITKVNAITVVVGTALERNYSNP